MYRKIIGFGIFAVVLAASIEYFSNHEEYSPDDPSISESRTHEPKKPETILDRDAKLNKQAMNLAVTSNNSIDHLPTSASKQSENRNSRFKANLKTEDSLIVRNSSEGSPEELYLDSSMMRSILTEDDTFDEAMQDFLSDEQESQNAMDLANAYRDMIDEFAEGRPEGDFNFQNFSCGHSICMGAIRTGSSDQTWTDFLDHLNNDGSTLTVFTENSVSIGDDIIEHRFFFATDPSIIGAMFWPK